MSLPTATVLIVDPNPEDLARLGDLLGVRHDVRQAGSTAAALRLARQEPRPDLVVLDVTPAADAPAAGAGYEVLHALRADPATRDIPVILTTSSLNGTDDEQNGLALGAVDCIGKPLRPAVVLARVQTQLELKAARDRLRSDNAELEALVARRLRDKEVIQDVTIRALARLAETRDTETGNHILRTQRYVQTLAGAAARHPRFAGLLDAATVALLAKSSPLHDIGKVGIPDTVLLKPGKLTPDEREVMKAHSRLGADAIARAQADSGQPIEFLDCAKQVALHHHERWDGSGYPDGLAGDAIPLAARVMAIADVFDALTTRRVYKPALPFEQVRALMAAERGRHFDPDLLDVFLDQFDALCAIARRHADGNGLPYD